MVVNYGGRERESVLLCDSVIELCVVVYKMCGFLIWMCMSKVC